MLPLLPSVTSLFSSAGRHRAQAIRRAVPARFPLLLLPTVHMQALTQIEIVYSTFVCQGVKGFKVQKVYFEIKCPCCPALTYNL